MSVYVCVCPIVASGMIWCDIGHVRDWLKKFHGFSLFYLLHMTLAVQKKDGCGHINTARHERLPKKTKVMRY